MCVCMYEYDYLMLSTYYLKVDADNTVLAADLQTAAKLLVAVVEQLHAAEFVQDNKLAAGADSYAYLHDYSS